MVRRRPNREPVSFRETTFLSQPIRRASPHGRTSAPGGPPPANPARGGAMAAKHSGAHRGDELQRFLVPLYGLSTEIRVGGGGAKGPEAHKIAPPPPRGPRRSRS